MKGLVFGKTFERASNKLDEIIESYKIYRYEIVQERKGNHYHQVIFDNGDQWKAVNASENSRGNKANVAYIDREIDDEIVRSMILRCIATGPWNATHYYG